MSAQKQHLTEITAALKSNKIADALKLYQALKLSGITTTQEAEIADAFFTHNQFEAAAKCFQAALQQLPGVAELHNNYGLSLLQMGKSDQALNEFKEAIRLKPAYLQAHFNLGKTFARLGQIENGLQAYEKALRIDPKSTFVLLNYGRLLTHIGRHVEAEQALRSAVLLSPTDLNAKFNLAMFLHHRSKDLAAIELFRQLENNYQPSAVLQHYLGISLSRLGRHEEAIECFKLASNDSKLGASASGNLGNCFIAVGKFQEGIKLLRKAVETEPDHADYRSALLRGLNYDPSLSPDQLVQEHAKYGNIFPPAPKWKIQRSTPIRLGYVSPDLRTHSVAYFMGALFEHRNREEFNLTVFSDAAVTDHVTEEFRAKSDTWIDSSHMGSKEFSAQVRSQGIDILCDLAGHTRGGRLEAFAARLAPIQITYLGYPQTTGLKAIDFRITDSLSDPVGYEHLYTEKLLRIEPNFLCYTPPKQTPAVAHTPVLNNKFITFGSFNALEKINPDVIKLWAEILLAIPGSRLYLKCRGFSDGSCQKYVQSQFEACGIAPERLRLMPHQNSHIAHLNEYSQVDIALDPFPYNGTTTTFEALLMGVPVISLTGDRHASRVGYSILSTLELNDLVSTDTSCYLRIAAELTRDLIKLDELRKSLRPRLMSSALCDGALFTRKFEEALKQNL